MEREGDIGLASPCPFMPPKGVFSAITHFRGNAIPAAMTNFNCDRDICGTGKRFFSRSRFVVAFRYQNRVLERQCFDLKPQPVVLLLELHYARDRPQLHRAADIPDRSISWNVGDAGRTIFAIALITLPSISVALRKCVVRSPNGRPLGKPENE